MTTHVPHGRAALERHFTASGLVMNRHRQLLLLQHRKFGVWLYPGGHIERTETPDQAVLREIDEETGIRATLVGKTNPQLADPNAHVTVLHRPYQVLCEFIDDTREPHYHIDLVYLCATAARTCPVQRENDRARFFTYEQTSGLRMFPNFRRLVHHLFRDETAWRLVDDEVIA
ncbi:NUDIX domain-containing protein [Mycetohabitans sp. B2]|uniref:NUDIX hydrolase n=1 Tax=Mycetohabitans sp. B2 TaxID=2841274 RepID=UPI001F2FC619|nr:NUDIX domain-containing protein [Mycetohabitans sp. B2]MCF7697391.1 NUDIX domain-containing protein [Mycetohabitans sp. B2]